MPPAPPIPSSPVSTREGHFASTYMLPAALQLHSNETAGQYLKRDRKTRKRGLSALTHSPGAVEVVLALAADPGDG